MNKVYKYRGYLHLIKFVNFALFTVFLSMTLIVIIFYGLDNNFLTLLVFLTLYSLFIIIMFNKMINSEFILKDRYLLYRVNKKDIKISYSDITKISFMQLSDFGGYMVIHTNKLKVRLTINVKNCTEFLDSLENKLIEENLEHLIDYKQSDKFYRLIIYTDDSFRRLKYLILVTLYFIIAVVISIFYMNYKDGLLFGASIISFFVLLLIYILTELIIFRRDLIKKFDRTKKITSYIDIKKEKNVYMFVTLFSISVHLVFVLLILVYL